MSQAVTADSRAHDDQLIIMWSVLAILCLVGLGCGWPAASPSRWLNSPRERSASLTVTSRQDRGHRGQRGRRAWPSFNQMTDSLKERSESLTKKVLELATLYEMSRPRAPPSR